MNYQPSSWLKEKQAEGDAPYALPALLNDNTLADNEARLAAEWCYKQNPKDFKVTDLELLEISLNKNEWTENYYFKQVSVTKFNFSLERFLHLVEVRNHLRAQGNPLFKFIVKKPVPQGRGQSIVNKIPASMLLKAGIWVLILLLLLIFLIEI